MGLNLCADFSPTSARSLISSHHHLSRRRYSSMEPAATGSNGWMVGALPSAGRWRWPESKSAGVRGWGVISDPWKACTTTVQYVPVTYTAPLYISVVEYFIFRSLNRWSRLMIARYVPVGSS